MGKGALEAISLLVCSCTAMSTKIFRAILWAVATLVPATLAAAEFESLFDGQSLDGWVLLDKQGEGYVASEGKLVATRNSGGNLMTAAEYDDFVFRFEFRLESGSNNGLCIRCPLVSRRLAYEGNELQIIDNSAERYKDIKSWQKHGSLYNVAPAKTGALKPVGEWNSQEVTVEGSLVQVVLNGTKILDFDISEVTNRATLARHPGLKRTSGHIGFLGHNEPVEFRNIFVKRLR